jgi:acyl dehydratase
MKAVKTLYFDDIAVGDVLTAGPYQTTHDEMVAFAQKWNPRPEYVRGETACIEYVRAVKQRLVSELGFGDAIIGAMGHDNTRYPNPARAGDAIDMRFEAIEMRPSRSKADRGVAKFDVTLANQNGDALFAYIDIIMMARRDSAAASG